MDMNPELQSRMMAATLDIAPMRMSEIVLKTSRFDAMKIWYQAVLGMAPFYEHTPKQAAQVRVPGQQERATDIRLCFIRLYLEHPYAQVLAIFDVPGTKDAPSGDPGLHHMQFRNATMDDLFLRYERLKALGMVPHRTANHGPGTSFYYRDPDQNIVEISASNFTSQDEYLAYFKSDSYLRNPSGIEIDPDEYIGRYRSGVPLHELVYIP